VYFSLQPESLTYIAAVEAADGQSLPQSVRLAIDEFISGCKTDGTWQSIKASCFLSGPRTLAGALIPLVGTAPTSFNFVSGDYDIKNGLKGNGSTKYLNSNRAGTADPQNNQSLSLFTNYETFTTVEALAGNFTTGTGLTLLQRNNTNDPVFTCQAGTTSRPFSTLPSGFYGVSRSQSGSYTFRANGSTSTITQASDGNSSQNHRVFTRGSQTLFTYSRIKFYSIGESLDLSLLDSRLTTYMAAITAATY
jgi:hypothetical protein